MISSWKTASTHNCTHNGFTLFEIVVVLLLIGWVGLAVFMTVPAWLNQWNKYVMRQDLLNEASAALNRMTREIRHVQDRAHITTANGTQFVFTDMDDHTIDYNWADNTLYRRYDAGEYQVLARDVSAFNFIYIGYRRDYAAGGPPEMPEELATRYMDGYTNIRLIRIQMSLQRNEETVTVRTGVAPRNLQFK